MESLRLGLLPGEHVVSGKHVLRALTGYKHHNGIHPRLPLGHHHTLKILHNSMRGGLLHLHSLPLLLGASVPLISRGIKYLRGKGLHVQHPGLPSYVHGHFKLHGDGFMDIIRGILHHTKTSLGSLGHGVVKALQQLGHWATAPKPTPVNPSEHHIEDIMARNKYINDPNRRRPISSEEYNRNLEHRMRIANQSRGGGLFDDIGGFFEDVFNPNIERWKNDPERMGRQTQALVNTGGNIARVGLGDLSGISNMIQDFAKGAANDATREQTGHLSTTTATTGFGLKRKHPKLRYYKKKT